MERIEILNQIINTENEAKTLRENAVRQQKQLSDSINAEIKKMRDDANLSVDQKISDFQASEKKRVETLLQRMSVQHNEKVEQLRALYEDKHEIWANKLFDIVIGR